MGAIHVEDRRIEGIGVWEVVWKVEINLVLFQPIFENKWYTEKKCQQKLIFDMSSLESNDDCEPPSEILDYLQEIWVYHEWMTLSTFIIT